MIDVFSKVGFPLTYKRKLCIKIDWIQTFWSDTYLYLASTYRWFSLKSFSSGKGSIDIIINISIHNLLFFLVQYIRYPNSPQMIPNNNSREWLGNISLETLHVSQWVSVVLRKMCTIRHSNKHLFTTAFSHVLHVNSRRMMKGDDESGFKHSENETQMSATVTKFLQDHCKCSRVPEMVLVCRSLPRKRSCQTCIIASNCRQANLTWLCWQTSKLSLALNKLKNKGIETLDAAS